MVKILGLLTLAAVHPGSLRARPTRLNDSARQPAVENEKAEGDEGQAEPVLRAQPFI